MKKTGAQLILEVLLEHGVDTVFGYPGGAALNVYDALYLPEITGLTMRRTAMPEPQGKRALFSQQAAPVQQIW